MACGMPGALQLCDPTLLLGHSSPLNTAIRSSVSRGNRISSHLAHKLQPFPPRMRISKSEEAILTHEVSKWWPNLDKIFMLSVTTLPEAIGDRLYKSMPLTSLAVFILHYFWVQQVSRYTSSWSWEPDNDCLTLWLHKYCIVHSIANKAHASIAKNRPTKL